MKNLNFFLLGRSLSSFSFRPNLTGRDTPILNLSATDYLQNKEIESEPEKHSKSISVSTLLVSSIHSRLPVVQQVKKEGRKTPRKNKEKQQEKVKNKMSKKGGNPTNSQFFNI